MQGMALSGVRVQLHIVTPSSLSASAVNSDHDRIDGFNTEKNLSTGRCPGAELGVLLKNTGLRVRVDSKKTCSEVKTPTGALAWASQRTSHISPRIR